jgi:hypothetical protein
MEDSVNKRIDIIVKKSIWKNASAFAKANHIPQKTLYGCIKLGNCPGFELLKKIYDAVPDLNLEWLFTGEGEMLKSVKEENKPLKRIEGIFESNDSNENEKGLILLQEAWELIREQSHTIASQQRTIEILSQKGRRKRIAADAEIVPASIRM